MNLIQKYGFRVLYIFALFLARCFEVNMDRAGNDIAGKNPVEGVSSALACQGLCAAESGCVAFTFQLSTGKCWLKSSSGSLSVLAGFTSGPVSC